MDRVTDGIERAHERYSATETVELVALGVVLVLLISFVTRSPITLNGLGLGFVLGVALLVADSLPRSQRARRLGLGLVGVVLLAVVVLVGTTPARDGVLVGSISVVLVVVLGATVDARRP